MFEEIWNLLYPNEDYHIIDMTDFDLIEKNGF